MFIDSILFKLPGGPLLKHIN